jgi:acyl-ACP thioesterase
LNTSGKKRTLSETMEDELLEATATETTNDDEPETKRKNPSQTSDIDENEEVSSITYLSWVFF